MKKVIKMMSLTALLTMAPTCIVAQQSVTTKASLQDVITITVKDVSFNMIKVEGGKFTMGATIEQGNDIATNQERPIHDVKLDSYYIGETEVTQGLWEAVMGSNPSELTGDNRLPVEHVSWNDCQTFITKLNQLTGKKFRLPTEAEWEYAARGGNKSRGYTFSGSNDIGAVAWYGDNSDDKPHPVKTKAPNEIGIYDMSGNLYEWCSDWYHEYSSKSQTNPTGKSKGIFRVARGGMFLGFPTCCRVAWRRFEVPSSHDNYTGLRLAL